MSYKLEIQKEAQRVEEKYQRDYSSHHEFYAVLLEEVQEVWDEIKKKNPDKSKLRKEVIQIGSVCLRYYEQIDYINE